jgi:hypothetical protein
MSDHEPVSVGELLPELPERDEERPWGDPDEYELWEAER